MDRRTASGIYMSSLKSWCASRALIAVWNCKYIFLFYSDKCSLEKTDSKGVGKSSCFLLSAFLGKYLPFLAETLWQLLNGKSALLVTSFSLSPLCFHGRADLFIPMFPVISFNGVQSVTVKSPVPNNNEHSRTMRTWHFFMLFFSYYVRWFSSPRISVQPHTLGLPSISILCPNKALPWLGDFPIFFNELYISYLSLDGTFLWMQKA